LANKGVILFTIDCGKQDLIYGSEVKTPFIDSLRSDGVTFTEAFSQANHTIPSMVSILTSLYLSDHKIYNYACDFNALPAHNLPQYLRQKGWRTAAACGSGVASTSLGQLFGKIGTGSLLRLRVKKIVSKIVNGIRRRFPWLSKYIIRLRDKRSYYADRPDAGLITDRAIALLNDIRPNENVFLWAHVFDAHYPYQVPAEYLALYNIDEQQHAQMLRRQKEYYGRGKLMSSGPKSGDDSAYFPLMYRATLTHIDAALGKLVKYLKDKNVYDDYMIILTADHGENLLEHGMYYGHDDLLDPSTKIPLVIKFPGNKHRGVEYAGLVEQVDIYPTIMAQFGYRPGDSKIRGINLLDLPAGHQVRDRYVISEDAFNTRQSIRDADWQLIKKVHPRDWVGTIDDYIAEKIKADGDQLLSRSDLSGANLIKAHPEEAERLSQRLVGIIKDNQLEAGSS
jgi:arylsulfatase A-like enzyme